MEASFAHLNPRNLRKTRQVGGYHYDPGKYTSSSNSNSGEKGTSRSHDPMPASEAGAATDESSSTTVEEYQVQADDELEAPWNQYAWMEELKFRVSC